MAGSGWRRLFLSQKQGAAGSWRLPALLRGRRRRRMALLIGIGLAQSVLAVVLALSVRQAFNQLLGADAGGAGGAWAAATALAALALGSVLRWREFLEAERLAQSYVHAVRVAVFRHAIRLGEAGMAQTSRSAVLLRFTGDLTPIRLWITRGLSRGLVAVTSIIVTLVVLLVIDPFIAVAIAASVLLTGLSALALVPALDRATREVRTHRTRMLKHAQERIARLAVVETQGDAVRERRLLAKKSDRLARASVVRGGMVGVLRAIGEAGAAAASLGALLIGALLAQYSLATPGAVVAAMLLAGLLSPKVQDLTRAFEYWTGARISIEKQQRFLALRPLGRRKGSSSRSRRLRDVVGHLRLVNVAYREQVSGVNLSLNPGDRLWLGDAARPEALALLRLAAGILQPTTGRVFLDETDLRKLHRRDARQHLAFVTADMELFDASLRANLTYGVNPSRAEGLDGLIAEQGLGKLFAELPGGLDHVVRESDRRITGGHRLLFGLVRARLSGARILLVDQADVALADAEAAAIDHLLAAYEGAVLWASRSKAPPAGYLPVKLSEALA